MIQVVKSLLSQSSLEFYNELQIILSKDNIQTLSSDEIDVFKYLSREYDINKQFPTAEIFLIKFPQYRYQLNEVDAFSIEDLRYYRKQFITKHQNIYKSKLLHKLAADAAVNGITPDMAESIRKQASFDTNIIEDEKISFRDRYTKSMKENSGIKTYIEQVDDEIGSISKGSVCTIAGFTGSLKCVSENERILTNKGMLTIKEIYNLGTNCGLKVQSEYGFRDLVAVHDEGIKNSYIIYIGGIPVETSPIHRFRVLTDNGELIWKEAQQLSIGDKVVQSLKESKHSGLDDDPDFWRLYGQMCGDGGYTSGQFYLCGALENIKKTKSEYLFSKFFNSYSLTISKPRKAGYKPLYNLHACANQVTRDELNDFIGKTSKTKVFPEKLFYLNRACWEAFILGLYETGGCSGRDCLGFGLTNKQFLIKLSRLLSGIGISTSLHQNIPAYKLSQSDTKHKGSMTYKLSIITAKSKNRFMNIIKSVDCKANNALFIDEIRDVSRPFYTREAFLKIKNDTKFNRYDYKFFGRFGTNTSGCNLKKITQVCEKYSVFKQSDYFNEIVDAELTWNKVTDIKTSSCYMYDLTVDGSPTYLLNGYVTHNTTMAVNIAIKNALAGKNIAYISLEVTKEQLEYSVLSLFSNDTRFSKLGYNPIQHKDIRQNRLDVNQINFLCDVLEPEYRRVIEPNFHILDETCFKTFSESEILEALYQLDDEKPLDAVFFDHAGLFAFKSPLYNSGNVGTAINKYVSFIREMSINFRVKNGEKRSIASVLLAQTNRTGWKEAANSFRRSKVPVRSNKNAQISTQTEGYRVSALSDANELERCSSVLMFIFFDPNITGTDTAYVQLSKTRYGQQLLPMPIQVEPEFYKFGGDASIDTSELSVDLIDNLAECSSNFGSAGTDIINDIDIFGL